MLKNKESELETLMGDLKPIWEEKGIEYCPMSAKYSKGVNEAFDRILDLLESKNMLEAFVVNHTKSVSLEGPEFGRMSRKSHRKRCC